MPVGETWTIKDYALAGRCLDKIYVFDMHGHLGNSGPFDRLSGGAEDVIEIMDRIGIDHLAISHLHSLGSDFRIGNDQVSEALERFQGRYIGYAVINPSYPDEIVAELDRCFYTLGMQGLKVHADFSRYPLDAPAYWKAYEYVQNHGGYPVLGHGFTADMLERATRDFPDVPFIPAHSAANWEPSVSDPVVDLAADHDNVYAELTGSIIPFGALHHLVKKVGAHKILYGSDICWQQATHGIGRVLMADIPDDEKRLILGLNAARIFRIEPEIRTYAKEMSEQLSDE